MLRASTGGMAFGPRDMLHAFQNVGDALGRLLVITTPSGLDRFFEQSGELPRPVDLEEIAAIGPANWIEFSGPPLGVSDPLQGTAPTPHVQIVAPMSQFDHALISRRPGN